MINTVPNAIIPVCKCRKRAGAADAVAQEEEEEDEEEDEEEQHEADTLGRLPAPTDMTLGGKILWVRGVNRIQTQVGWCFVLFPLWLVFSPNLTSLQTFANLIRHFFRFAVLLLSIRCKAPASDNH